METLSRVGVAEILGGGQDKYYEEQVREPECAVGSRGIEIPPQDPLGRALTMYGKDSLVGIIPSRDQGFVSLRTEPYVGVDLLLTLDRGPHPQQLVGTWAPLEATVDPMA